MKKFLLIICVVFVFFTGCTIPADYHEGNSREWIERQVQNGSLTREEADKLLEQE